MISEFQTLVAKFNKGVGQRLHENGLDEERMINLRVSLIDEESKETVAAMREHSAVMTIDGLCDVLYVTYGAADVYGLVLETAHEENLTPTGKIDWPEILNCVDSFLDSANQAMHAIRQQKPEEMKIRLQELAQGCWECAAEGIGVDLRPFFREVHRTNMWKLKGPKREDGKQLKPPDWHPPRLEGMYNRALAGNPPSCHHADAGLAVMAYPHPLGGHFCPQCGGLLVDWLEIT